MILFAYKFISLYSKEKYTDINLIGVMYSTVNLIFLIIIHVFFDTK